LSEFTDLVFGDDGLLAAQFEGYEPRSMQTDMANAVEAAFGAKEHLIVEAPCGTGKSFAYLVPAVQKALAAKVQVIVATANIALQEQLASKDLPFLQGLLADDAYFTFALLKGKGNYLCTRRLGKFSAKVESRSVNLPTWKRKQLTDIQAWAKKTVTGDKSELDFNPDGDVWMHVCGDTEECAGDSCDGFTCYFLRARATANEANIVVTNYHLLFAHVALLHATGRHCIFPDLQYLICDEAHEIPNIARSFLGWQVTDYAPRHIVNLLEEEGDRLADSDSKDDRDRGQVFFRVAQEVDAEHRKLFQVFDKLRTDPERIYYDGIRMRRKGLFDPEPLANAIEAAKVFLLKLSRAAGGEKMKALYNSVISMAGNLVMRLSDAYHLVGDPNVVYWLEEKHGRGKGTRLCAKPVDVSAHLRQFLFRSVSAESLHKGFPDTPQSVVITSATLSTGGNFDFIEREIGYEGGKTLELDSPFDFSRQALFVCPEMENTPRDKGFCDEVAWHVNELIEAADGRVLGLFTSYRNLDAMRETVKDSNGRKVLYQGDAPRTKMVRQFRDELTTSLLGTMSMWTGVDVQGESLTALVIDKLPFPSPSEPVMDALKEIRPNSFMTDFIPRATMIFKQGFGRLIRSQRDYGVVVVLDRRLFDKPYGGLIMRSLPPCRRTRNVGEVGPFLKYHREK